MGSQHARFEHAKKDYAIVLDVAHDNIFTPRNHFSCYSCTLYTHTKYEVMNQVVVFMEAMSNAGLWYPSNLGNSGPLGTFRALGAERKCDLHVLRELGLVDYSLLMAFHLESKRVRLAIIDFLQPYTLNKQPLGQKEEMKIEPSGLAGQTFFYSF